MIYFGGRWLVFWIELGFLIDCFFLHSQPLVCMQTVVLKVGMSCQGCVGAVKRVLGKMDGLFLSLDLSTFPSYLSLKSFDTLRQNNLS